MKVVIADTGALISLAHINCIGLIEDIFGDFSIAHAVWVELQAYDNPNFESRVIGLLKKHVVRITTKNHLSMILDYGESESVILYGELQADYLLIDDQRARIVAESLKINCVGSIGLLIRAKNKGLISELKPHFIKLITTGRYFSKKLLNKVLIDSGEVEID